MPLFNGACCSPGASWMNDHEKLQSLVSEYSDDYLLVARIGNDTEVVMSDPRFARAILDQIEPAIVIGEGMVKGIPCSRKHSRKKEEPEAPAAS
jgi:hypothetical protein